MRRKNFLFVALLIGCPFTSVWAMARGLPIRPCGSILKRAALTPGEAAVSRTDPTKSLYLESLRVKNQRDYGCCWISSALGRWERQAKVRFGREVPLSETHMILASLFYRIDEGIYIGRPVSQGGRPEVAEWMATHVGLVPEEAYRWKRDLRDPKVGDEIVARLNTAIEEFQSELAKMKREGATEEAAWNFATRTKSRLFAELREKIGNFPATFFFEGKKYTPHSFAASITPPGPTGTRTVIFPTEPRPALLSEGRDSQDKMTRAGSLFGLFPRARLRLPDVRNKYKSGSDSRSLTLYDLAGRAHARDFQIIDRSLDEIHVAIENSILAGQPVYIDTAMIKDYIRNDTGIISLAAHGATAKSAALSPSSYNHVMLITGIHRDHEGNLLGYRIQNSWGERTGVLGYYAMDLDYFDAFLCDIALTLPSEVLQKKPKSP